MGTPSDPEPQLLKNFRRVVRSHVELFRSQRDHVHHLLGGKHHYSSGAFREGLLKAFLKSVLPSAVSVDSGFIYGFEQVPNSRQIDVLVWDSSRHSAVFRAGDFVIVPPESVIAALSVKSTLDRAELTDALENLSSIVPLDLAYRTVGDERGDQLHRPILKIVVAYDTRISVDALLAAASDFHCKQFATDAAIASPVCKALSEFDPVHPSDEHVRLIGRVLPALVTVIADNEVSLYRGWGPPEDRLATTTYGPGLRRLPYLYTQRAVLTTPIEKLVYHVLAATYGALGTRGWSLVSAWGEIDPRWGLRFTDTDEIEESTGVRLLDPTHLAA